MTENNKHEKTEESGTIPSKLKTLWSKRWIAIAVLTGLLILGEIAFQIVLVVSAADLTQDI